MPASVPTQAEFDALTARVTKLEQGSTTGESPQGATITGPGTYITMANGTKVSLTAAGGQVSFDPGGVDTTTSNVITGLMWDHKFYQENTAHNWYYGTKGSWTQAPGDPRAPANPKFHVSNGKIIGPNGQPFTGRGINCGIDQLNQLVTDLTTCAPVTNTFPNIKYVRCNVYVKDMPGYGNTFMEAQINALTKLGIVVVIDPHDYPGYYTGSASTKGCYSGDDLTKVCNYMRGMAQKYASNSAVWYSTENEPGNDFGAKLVQDMIIAIYNAVRQGSADAIVQLNAVGSYTIEPWTGFDASIWRNFTQCALELHYYNWASKYGNSGQSYSTDLATNKQAIAHLASMLQAAHTADGVAPIIIGEYGDSTSGEGIDPGGMVAVQAVHESGYGTAAWHWMIGGSHPGDVLLNPPPSTLTNPYGTTVRDHIRAGA